jgi:glutamate-ammonia-ligase adenylyltransferase
VRDLFRICTVEETLTALSVLAESLISAAFWISALSLRREYDVPRTAFTHFGVLGMGKLGAGELNFSSDVDLIYVYTSEDEEAGGLGAADYYRRLSRKITAGLNEFTSEGYVYRVDLRLRLEGLGSIAHSLDDYRRYYRTRIGTWERLALLKAAPIAGNRAVGRAFLDMAKEFIYDLPFDASAAEDVRNMKRKIDQQMLAREQQSCPKDAECSGRPLPGVADQLRGVRGIERRLHFPSRRRE